MSAPTSKQALLNCANATNDAELTEADVSFSLPTPTDADPRGNTVVTISATPTSEYEGEGPYYYDRLDMQMLEVLDAEGNAVPFVVRDGQTYADVLPFINTAQRTGLTAEDLLEPTVAIPEDATDSITVKASPTSYAWLHELVLQIRRGKIPLSEVLPNNVLDGLTWDGVVEWSGRTEPEVTQVVNLTSRQLTKPDGSTLAGTGNPATGFQVATNNEVYLGLRVGKYQDAQYDPATGDGNFYVNILDGQDWNFSMTASKVPGAPGSLFEDYNLTLQVKDVASGQQLNFALTLDANGLAHLTDTAKGIDIIDGYLSTDKNVYQEHQRVSLYVEHLPGVTKNAEGKPYGMFEFRFVAQHKRDDIAGVIVDTVAEITSGPQT